MSDFHKRGTVKRTIKYTTKDGKEQSRYVTVGEYWSTDGGNRQAVKIYATLNTDEQWLNIYPLDENDERPRSVSHEFNKKVHDVLPNDDDINLETIPF